MPLHKFPLSAARSFGQALLLSAVLWGAFAAPVQAAPRAQTVDPAELETFLEALMADHLERFHIPGAALVVMRDGAMLLARGYGYADLEGLDPVDPAETLFRPGSAAKLITWTAVMQLVEQGRLDLHADVNDYLDFAIPASFPEPVTLAHLLAHTPGFENVGEGLFLLSAGDVPPLGDYLRLRLPARVFPPGQVGAYSNYGTALAGYIVERVSGEPFEAYVENHIFAPLDMRHSTFRQPVPSALAGMLAAGYGYHDGRYLRGEFEFIGPYPAGSMSAPATDMARFALAHLQDGSLAGAAVLQPQTVRAMHAQLYTPDPRLAGMAHGFMERTVNGRRTLYHTGSTLLFHSGLYLLPEENLGLYVSYNSRGGIPARDLLWQTLLDLYYPAPAPAAAAPSAASAERLAAFAGEYHPAVASFSDTGKVIRLLEAAQVSAGPAGRLVLTREGVPETFVEVEPGLYRHEQRGDRLAFRTDAAGTAWLHQDSGAPFAFFRVPWYATSLFTALLFLTLFLLYLASSIGWLIGGWRARRGNISRPLPAHAARWLAALFGLLFVAFLLAFIGLVADVDPAYGVPRIFFSNPPLLIPVTVLPWLLAIMTLALALFSAFAWLGTANAGRPYWNLWGRLHYTLLAGLALAATWWLSYWQFMTI